MGSWSRCGIKISPAAANLSPNKALFNISLIFLEIQSQTVSVSQLSQETGSSCETKQNSQSQAAAYYPW